MLKAIEKLKFLWRSTNEHGVHSPFVYSLLTNVYYSSKDKELSKKLSFADKNFKRSKNIVLKDSKIVFLAKLIGYFKAQQVNLVGQQAANLTEILKRLNPELDIKVNSFAMSEKPIGNCIYYISQDVDLGNISRKINQIADFSVILIDNIYQTADRKEFFCKIAKGENISVSIDSYTFGLLFVNRDLSRQNFSIRT